MVGRGARNHLDAPAEVASEADVELVAVLHRSEEAVAAVAPGIGAHASADLALCDLANQKVGQVCTQADYP